MRRLLLVAALLTGCAHWQDMRVQLVAGKEDDFGYVVLVEIVVPLGATNEERSSEVRRPGD